MALRKRIGVMVPSTNTTFEADFQLVAPRDVTIHGQRLWLTNGDEGAAGNQGINDHDPEEVVAFASRVCRPDADALLCSCTAWRSVEAVAELERRTGKPVVTSNQASIWASFRALGVRPALKGFGRLLQDLAA